MMTALERIPVPPDHAGLRAALEAAGLPTADLDAGARDAYLLTTDAAGWFAQLGFAPVPRAAAPAAILATRQAREICASAALLHRRLADG